MERWNYLMMLAGSNTETTPGQSWEPSRHQKFLSPLFPWFPIWTSQDTWEAKMGFEMRIPQLPGGWHLNKTTFLYISTCLSSIGFQSIRLHIDLTPQVPIPTVRCWKKLSNVDPHGRNPSFLDTTRLSLLQENYMEFIWIIWTLSYLNRGFILFSIDCRLFFFKVHLLFCLLRVFNKLD